MLSCNRSSCQQTTKCMQGSTISYVHEILPAPNDLKKLCNGKINDRTALPKCSRVTHRPPCLGRGQLPSQGRLTVPNASQLFSSTLRIIHGSRSWPRRSQAYVVYLPHVCNQTRFLKARTCYACRHAIKIAPKELASAVRGANSRLACACSSTLSLQSEAASSISKEAILEEPLLHDAAFFNKGML